MALLLAGCAGPSPTGGTAEITRGPEPGADVRLTALDNTFDPTTASAGSGELVVELRNAGEIVHNLVSSDGQIATGPLEPGAVVSFPVTIDGEWNYSCTLHPGMDGMITP